MPTRADQILIELAVKNHLITEAEGAECLQAQAGEPGVEVGAILVRKQYLKERHLKSLRRKLEKVLEEEASVTKSDAGHVPPPPPPAGGDDPTAAMDKTFVAPDPDSSPLLSTSGSIVLFGQIGVKLGMVGEDILQRALQKQEELAEKGTPMRIGEVLYRAGQLTVEQVREILEYQKKWIFACTICTRRYNVEVSQEQGPSLRCGSCGGPLVVASKSGIHVDDTHAAASEPLKPMPAASKPPDEQVRREPTPDDPAGLLGMEWKGYRVDKILGKGGMGAVYQALQKSLKREVALKVMLRGASKASPDERERFEREAKLIGNLNHPNIVKVIHAEWDTDLCWFTMEMVPGEDFKATLRSGSFPMGKGAAVVAKVARAMDFAHKKGIIHRDLKPQNVMIDEESGEPKVLDFGLAKNVDQNTMQQLTQMGAFLGTPSYMAPEQAGGDPNAIDARADVYALGAILYEVLTGRPPFTGKKAIQVIRKVLKDDPVPCRQVFEHADARLEAICLKALQKVPGDRYQSAGDMADAIEEVIGKVSRSFGSGVQTPSAQASAGAGSSSGEDDSKKKGFFGRLFGG